MRYVCDSYGYDTRVPYNNIIMRHIVRGDNYYYYYYKIIIRLST